MVSKSHKYDIEDIFNQWCYDYSSYDLRYKKSERPKILEEFCLMAKNDGYTIDDIRFYKKKIMDFIVAQQGQKNAGKKHKLGDWLENAEADFDRVLADMFVDKDSLLDSYDDNHIAQNEKIVEWCKSKGITEPKLVQEAHKMFSYLFVDFMQETFYQESSGESK